MRNYSLTCTLFFVLARGRALRVRATADLASALSLHVGIKTSFHSGCFQYFNFSLPLSLWLLLPRPAPVRSSTYGVSDSSQALKTAVVELTTWTQESACLIHVGHLPYAPPCRRSLYTSPCVRTQSSTTTNEVSPFGRVCRSVQEKELPWCCAIWL